MRDRQQTADLTTRLRDAVLQQEPIATAFAKLLDSAREDLKESLVQADGEDMLRLQGAARTLAKLHRDLTTAPPTTLKDKP